MKNLAAKIPRYRKLGKDGFSKTALARATVMPAASYGPEVVGYSDSALHKLRVNALAAVASATGGGHMDAEWAARDGSTGKLDPAFEAHAAPLVTLAEAWWSCWRSHHELKSAHDAAWTALNKRARSKSSPWSFAAGPNAAAILSAGRLGWHFAAADVLITDKQERLELGTVPLQKSE